MATTTMEMSGATDKSGVADPQIVHSIPQRKQNVFRIELNSAVSAEINFKDLQRQYQLTTASHADTCTHTNVEARNRLDAEGDDAKTGERPEESAPFPSRNQRYNIIERLEKRYGGGTVVDCSENAGMGNGGGFDRGDDDDLYDSEDSFIDDSELQQNIEELHGQTKVKTKHSGFFVNAGDEIETLEKDESDELEGAEGSHQRKHKRSKKGGAESSRAVKAFLDEWSDAASDWQPGPDVMEGLEVLRNAVRELAEVAPITKVFPRKLDDPLRNVDKLVVESHPNKWRVNGYFATLMAFLPFTKQYLKSNMLRLEARDVARDAKEQMEQAFQALFNEVSTYVHRAETCPVKTVKEEILQDRALAMKLHGLVGLQDTWILKENEYRQMLKTEDKKHLKEQDYLPLNARQERNRIFNRVLGLFSPGLMDLQSLRGLNKMAKTKLSKKSPQVKATSKPSVVNKKKSQGAPAPSAAPTKRAIRPFKSRMLDDVPPFTEADFEEIL